MSLTRLKPPWEMRSIWSGIHPCDCFAAFRPITLAETERNALVKTRIDELDRRADTIINEKQKAQEEDM